MDTSPTFKVLEEGTTTLSKRRPDGLHRTAEVHPASAGSTRENQNNTYGICRETGKLISKDRLRAVPHATLCIDAKMKQK